MVMERTKWLGRVDFAWGRTPRRSLNDMAVMRTHIMNKDTHFFKCPASLNDGPRMTFQTPPHSSGIVISLKIGLPASLYSKFTVPSFQWRKKQMAYAVVQASAMLNSQGEVEPPWPKR
jgi:hypothetical protein